MALITKTAMLTTTSTSITIKQDNNNNYHKIRPILSSGQQQQWQYHQWQWENQTAPVWSYSSPGCVCSPWLSRSPCSSSPQFAFPPAFVNINKILEQARKFIYMKWTQGKFMKACRETLTLLDDPFHQETLRNITFEEKKWARGMFMKTCRQTLTLLADAFLVLNQLVDERLKTVLAWKKLSQIIFPNQNLNLKLMSPGILIC